MHLRNFIHRDLKPDNIMMGLGEDSSNLFLVDFGLTRSIIDKKTGKHIKLVGGKNLLGLVATSQSTRTWAMSCLGGTIWFLWATLWLTFSRVLYHGKACTVASPLRATVRSEILKPLFRTKRCARSARLPFWTTWTTWRAWSLSRSPISPT